jgi:GNAT superfamily N-acetyltransferase
MIVRKMLPSELDVTINLCGYYAQEALIPEDEYDEDAVLETIRLYSSHYEYFWFNAYDGQRPVGIIAGYVTKEPWSKTKLHAHIELIFLLESHRSMDNFRTLLNKSEEWARTVGATEITAGDIGINPERTQKLYSHFDFKPGVWMGKELINV